MSNRDHGGTTSFETRGRLFVIAGVVDVDGPLDLEAFMAIEQQVCGAPVVEQLLGGGPANLAARYREASATGLLPIATKQELLIASRANESWIGAIRSYAATAEKAGDSVVVTMMENSGHFDGLNPKAPAWATGTRQCSIDHRPEVRHLSPDRSSRYCNPTRRRHSA